MASGLRVERAYVHRAKGARLCVEVAVTPSAHVSRQRTRCQCHQAPGGLSFAETSLPALPCTPLQALPGQCPAFSVPVPGGGRPCSTSMWEGVREGPQHLGLTCCPGAQPGSWGRGARGRPALLLQLLSLPFQKRRSILIELRGLVLKHSDPPSPKALLSRGQWTSLPQQGRRRPAIPRAGSRGAGNGSSPTRDAPGVQNTHQIVKA